MFSYVRACANCGANNRVGARHLTSNARCGKCKTPMGPVSQPIDVNASDFDEITTSATVPILIDFWADWCGPCKMAAPSVKQVAHDMAGKAIVLKVDSDAHSELSARYNVRGIPNFVVLKQGRVVTQHAGVKTAPEMKRWLESAGNGE